MQKVEAAGSSLIIFVEGVQEVELYNEHKLIESYVQKIKSRNYDPFYLVKWPSKKFWIFGFYPICSVDWELEAKSRSVTNFAFYPDFSMLGLHKIFGNGQSQT